MLDAYKLCATFSGPFAFSAGSPELTHGTLEAHHVPAPCQDLTRRCPAVFTESVPNSCTRAPPAVRLVA
jgi:hypothetical protein